MIRHRTGERFGSSATQRGAARPSRANITNVHFQRFLGASEIKNRGFDPESVNQCFFAEGALSPAGSLVPWLHHASERHAR